MGFLGLQRSVVDGAEIGSKESVVVASRRWPALNSVAHCPLTALLPSDYIGMKTAYSSATHLSSAGDLFVGHRSNQKQNICRFAAAREHRTIG